MNSHRQIFCQPHIRPDNKSNTPVHPYLSALLAALAVAVEEDVALVDVVIARVVVRERNRKLGASQHCPILD